MDDFITILITALLSANITFIITVVAISSCRGKKEDDDITDEDNKDKLDEQRYNTLLNKLRSILGCEYGSLVYILQHIENLARKEKVCSCRPETKLKKIKYNEK